MRYIERGGGERERGGRGVRERDGRGCKLNLQENVYTYSNSSISVPAFVQAAN